MRVRPLMLGLMLSIGAGLIAASPVSPEVSLEKALSMPAAELAATCNHAVVAKRYVELARAGASVNIGRRRVTARNADSVAAEIDAQLEVCRAAVGQRGVAAVAGRWSGNSTGCERAGSMLADAVAMPGTIVSFDQDGTALTMTVSGKTDDGSEYSFPAPGTVIEHYITVRDPINSDYVLQGEATDASVVLRPDTKTILAAWPAWAGPPKAADLEGCVVSLQRVTEAPAGGVEREP